MAAGNINPETTSPVNGTQYDDNPLSEREMEVSRLLVTGLSNSQIARELLISTHTVKVHLRNVFEKLHVSSRTEATMVLLQRGWLTMPGVNVAVAEPALSQPEIAPDPEPLADLPAQPLPWQRAYLLGITLACCLTLLAPNLLSRPKSSTSLLSDSGQMVVGQPILEMEPRWELRTPLEQPRSRMAAVQLGDHIYVIGGEEAGGQTTTDVTAYDLNVNEWRSLPSLPQPWANLAAAEVHDRIYVAGGSANSDGDRPAQLSDEVYVLNPNADRWEEFGKLPSPLAGAAMVAQGDALYLLGGWDGQQVRDEMWRLVTSADEEAPPGHWELVGRLPIACAFLGAAVAGDEIYVIGGYDGQRDLDQAHVYSLAASVWRRLPPLSTPRSGLSVLYDGLAVLVFGGGWTHTIDTNERYDPITGQWSKFLLPIQGEWRHFAAANRDGDVHLIGGWSGDYLDTHLSYKSYFRAMIPLITVD